MSSGVNRYGDREIARGLVQALRPALAADARPIDRLAARDVAQLLGLHGLEAALVLCDAHAGGARPREVEHLAERLARIADAAEAEGSVAAFLAADRELQTLATHLEHVEWEAPSAATPAATYPVAEQLAGLALDATSSLDTARVTAPVAASLRAALDWLGVDERARTSVIVQDSALELSVRVSFPGGLAPAGAVLAAVEGSLGEAEDGRWVIRLPLAASRPSFLLLRQGHLGLALPWHSVARLRMVREGELAQLAESVLAPLAASGDAGGERPAALLALGLQRAWFAADRIVWRIVAEPEDADVASPIPGLTQMIMVDGESRYWIVDPAAMLRGVEPVAVPAPAPRPRASLLLGADVAEPVAAAAAPAPAPESSPAPAPAPAPEDPFAVLDDLLPALASDTAPMAAPPPALEDTFDAPTVAAPAAFTPVVEVLRSEDLLAPRAAAAAQPAPAVAIAPVEAPAPAAAASPRPQLLRAADVEPLELVPPRPRRALVVDDSLVARIFLTRMLEQRGFPVVTGENAADLWAGLEGRPFGVVFVDVCLPDARGRAHLERVLAAAAKSAEPFTTVVLTRDRDDEIVAEAAGVKLMLRKPFESAALDQLLMKLPRLPQETR